MPGGSYYTMQNGSAVLAVKIPENPAKGFRIAASHSDSPCFKIKEVPEMKVENTYVKLNVEKYGGMILSRKRWKAGSKARQSEKRPVDNSQCSDSF